MADVSPAHDAARNGDEAKLRLLPHAALSAASQKGSTPAHTAAQEGHEGCLRVLHELGGAAAASLSAADEKGSTPAYRAAKGEPHEPTWRPNGSQKISQNYKKKHTL